MVLSSPINSCLRLKRFKSPKTSRINSMRFRRGLRRNSKRIPTLFLTRIQYLQRETLQVLSVLTHATFASAETRFVLCVLFNYPLQSSIFNLCIPCLVYHHYHYIHTTCSTTQTIYLHHSLYYESQSHLTQAWNSKDLDL